MKVSAITCHDVYNYGASLQAYALQEYCRSLGCDYEIIDYKPDYLSGHYNLAVVNNPRFNRPLLKQLYILAKFPERLLNLRKKKRFDNFTKKYLTLSSIQYNCLTDLTTNPPSADIYIAGSDQIWNTLFKNGHDPAFYLSFVPEGKKKISYAASLATNKIYGNIERSIKEKLQSFDAISVREKSGVDILESLGLTDICEVCDPVFLLNLRIWEDLIKNIKNKEKGKYILVYDCEQSEEVQRRSMELAKLTGLKILNVSAIRENYSDVNCQRSGPLEFINLLANAQYVIANSFHALAFSLIFHREFFIISRSLGINSRMMDFLDKLKLQKRLLTREDKINLEPIDFVKTDQILELFISHSKLFLENQLKVKG